MMRLVVNCASTCANQTSGSAGQNGGSLMVTALMAGVLLRREPVAKGEAVEVVAVPSEAEAVELVVELVVAVEEAVDMMDY